MDSTDSGPPPRKRFMNGNQEGQARFSESGSRGGRPSRGFRGRGFPRGRGGSFRGGFRGYSEENSGADGDFKTSYPGRGSTPFRGRGSSPFGGRGRSTSLSSPDDHAPGVRGGRGSFRARGSFSGFRGRGGSPGFRGRGFAPGIRGASGFRGRGGGIPGSRPNQTFSINIYNLDLPSSKSFFEQKEFIRGMLSDFKCLQIDIVAHAGPTRAICYLQNEDTVRRACKDLNGRFVQDSQILVTGANKHNPRNTPVLITNLPESALLSDLVEVLHGCKAISHIGPLPATKSALGYMFVFVCGEDDVKRLMDKSSTKIKGSKILTKCLDPNLVARTEGLLEDSKWQKILGTDIVYYIYKAPHFTDIYFESSADLEEALKKAEEYYKDKKSNVKLQRRYLHECFFAEVCDVEGDVNDAELYTLVRKHGEISEFKRLDKDYYMIKQELNAAMAAMSLSESKGCGGTLKFSWSNTRIPKIADVETGKGEKKKKKKNSVKKESEGNDSEESAGDQTNSSLEDEKMNEDDEEDEEEDDDVDDGEEEEGDEETEEEEEESIENVVVKEESEDEDVLIARRKFNKNKNSIRQVPQSSRNIKQTQRPKKRKISSSA